MPDEQSKLTTDIIHLVYGIKKRTSELHSQLSQLHVLLNCPNIRPTEKIESAIKLVGEIQSNLDPIS